MLPARCWAWGCAGHPIIALVAQANLNPTARAQVAGLLSDAEQQYLRDTGREMHRYCPATDLGPMAYFSTWADDERTEADMAWHFWNIPIVDTKANLPDFCGSGCVATAIPQQIAILRSDAPRDERQRALLYLIHLMGDAHQPLHVADNGDRGGNCIPVSVQFRGFSRTTHEESRAGHVTGAWSPNLHSVWDDTILETMMGETRPGPNAEQERDARTEAFATLLERQQAGLIRRTAAKRIAVDNPGLIVPWAVRTHAAAITRTYDGLPVTIPVEPRPDSAELKSCAPVSENFAAMHIVLGPNYIRRAQPVVRRQLALAGARLADILNTLWPAHDGDGK
jgi:hypothetical protein